MAKTRKTKDVKRKAAPVKARKAKSAVAKNALKKKSASAKRPPAKVVRPKAPSGLPEILRDEALKIISDRQGEEVVTIDLTGRSSVADYLIIATARNTRQSSAIAHYLREAFAKHGIKHVRSEGLREGNWAVIDGGDIIIHLFRPEVRSYYDLESIWDGSKSRRDA